MISHSSGEINGEGEADVSVENLKSHEERVLSVGYFAQLTERYPFNKDPMACSSLESGCFLDLEKTYMWPPPELAFAMLKDSIAPSHRARLEKIWQGVVEWGTKWLTAGAALEDKWQRIPPMREDDAELSKRVIDNMRIAIREQLMDAAVMMAGKKKLKSAPPLSFAPDTENGSAPISLSRREAWRREEKGLRLQFYNADKNYLVALRLYYEMLLEEPPASSSQESVLPPDHPLRQRIVMCNRYARLIDITHQALSSAKAAHHVQPKKRIRKTREEPYYYHPLAVTLAQIMDFMPYIIEQEKEPFNLVMPIITAALHDLAEDTDLTIEDIISFLTRLADKYDSTLDPLIESGFKRSRQEIKRCRLDLVDNNVLVELREMLKLLSNKTILNRRGKKNVNNLKRSKRLQFKIAFPQIEEQKLIDFLMKLLALTGGVPKNARKRVKRRRRQIILSTKIQDRAHNISQLVGRKPEYQLTTLRGTVAHLIAYAILDHDHAAMPLYNSLPRLIDITLCEYQRFISENPTLIAEKDRDYIKKLQEWQHQK